MNPQFITTEYVKVRASSLTDWHLQLGPVFSPSLPAPHYHNATSGFLAAVQKIHTNPTQLRLSLQMAIYPPDQMSINAPDFLPVLSLTNNRWRRCQRLPRKSICVFLQKNRLLPMTSFPFSTKQENSLIDLFSPATVLTHEIFCIRTNAQGVTKDILKCDEWPFQIPVPCVRKLTRGVGSQDPVDFFYCSFTVFSCPNVLRVSGSSDSTSEVWPTTCGKPRNDTQLKQGRLSVSNPHPFAKVIASG